MSSTDVVIRQFTDALLRLDSNRARSLLADLHAPPENLPSLENIVVPALESLGRDWERGLASLSQVYMAGRICEQIMSEMLPAGQPSFHSGPRLAIGVLEDHHALGKRMVLSSLHSAGYHVQDYGCGRRAAELVEMALRDQVDVLLVSCLMLASAVHSGEVVAGLREAGSPAAVVVGGAPFRLDPQLWQEVGAQAGGSTCAEAVGIVRDWEGGRVWG